ncbi:MAG: SurA N-terminal domain-containing protein [Spirochaetales bacterium]|nr:SurA N-terminal domain-containing protein [Spirochaetales bacterium]
MASRDQRRKNQKVKIENVEAAEKRKSNRPVMWTVSLIILVVIVVTFVGAPVAGKIGSTGNTAFGSYDGEEIVYTEGSFFSDQVNAIAEDYRDSITDQNAQFIQYQVWRTAFDNTVFRTAVIKELRNSGVHIPGTAVDKAIVTYGPYMENGEFSENLYSQSSNIEKKSTRKKFEEELYYNQFLIDSNSYKINKNEEKFFQNLASTEKKFRYAVFPFSDFPSDNIASFGSHNADLFRKIIISKITVKSDKKDAEQILSKLEQDPAVFTEMAKTQSSDPYADKGGEMGSRYYYELKNFINNGTALDEIFALDTGEISSIIEDDGTWVIYRCDKKAEYSDMSIDADIQVVKEYMERFEKGVIEDYLVKQAGNFAEFAKTEGFLSASADSDVSIHDTISFPIVYGNPSVNYYGQSISVYTQVSSADEDTSLSGVNTNEFFLKSINALAENEVSEPIIINDNVVVIQLIETTEKNTEELSSVAPLISYASQNWQGNQLKEFIFQSDKFNDNFGAAFARIFISN